MKKWFIVLTLMLSLSSLCACQNKQVDVNNNGANAETDQTGQDDDQGTTDNSEDTAYKDIERYQATGYEKSYFGFSDDLTMLGIEHPIEWSFSETTEGFDIIRDDMVVGHIVSGATSDTENWTPLTATNSFVGAIGIKRYIESNRTDEEAQYRYRYVYEYSAEVEKHTITLITTCAELDKTSEANLMDAFKQKTSAGQTMGILSEHQDDWRTVLILGNSFVRTSNIGNILSEMLRLNGKRCDPVAVSFDGATVETYINNGIIDYIRIGDYDAVFICGFYDPREVANLGILKEACEQSETELIVFPAHNEIEATLSSVQTTYPSLDFLNWKGEIECIIASGVDRWELCINDYQNHSKPLAGYVGAHMIYRAIYNELPKATMQNSISQSYIDSILGDYAYTGKVEVIDEDKIIYLD